MPTSAPAFSTVSALVVALYDCPVEGEPDRGRGRGRTGRAPPALVTLAGLHEVQLFVDDIAGLRAHDRLHGEIVKPCCGAATTLATRFTAALFVAELRELQGQMRYR